jgi:hypothetical protein
MHWLFLADSRALLYQRRWIHRAGLADRAQSRMI